MGEAHRVLAEGLAGQALLLVLLQLVVTACRILDDNGDAMTMMMYILW